MAKLRLPLFVLSLALLLGSVAPSASAVKRPTKEIAGMGFVWLTRGPGHAADLNLDLVPNPPEHGPTPGSNPPLLDIDGGGAFSLWLRDDDRHYYLARSGTLAMLDPFVAAASKSTSGGQWVCVHGDQRSHHQQFLTLMRHLRDAGYPKVCIVEWSGDPGR